VATQSPVSTEISQYFQHSRVTPVLESTISILLQSGSRILQILLVGYALICGRKGPLEEFDKHLKEALNILKKGNPGVTFIDLVGVDVEYA
jgi:hypothetical protein